MEGDSYQDDFEDPLPPADTQRLITDIGPSSDLDETKHQLVLQHLGMMFAEPFKTYQKSLAAPGIKGVNSIIALKTGAGKTRTAAYVAKFHKVRSRILNKVFKGVFVVPIRTLTAQQKKVFDLAFPAQSTGPSKVGSCLETGEFKEKFDQSDIIMCTAQVLVNNLRQKKVSLKDISLLILDECHHTAKKHPYHYIMKYYKKLKYESEAEESNTNCYKPGEGHLPQILGLSASLGAESKNRDETRATRDAFERLAKMCVNLDSAEVSFPERPQDVESLEEFSPDSGNDEVVYVDGRGPSAFLSTLMEMASAVARSPHPPIDLSALTANLRPNYSAIYADLVDKEKDFAANDLVDSKIAAIYSKLFCRSAEHLNLMRAIDVYRFLNIKLTEDHDSEWILLSRENELVSVAKREVHEQWTDNQETLSDLATKESGDAVPIIRELEKLLVNLYRNENSKGIILSRTRYSTEALMDFILTSPSLMEKVVPGRLVGHAEMSDPADQEILQKFDSGVINLLVATDIAQEGLDIPSCNFVIRYSFVSNEIGDVQAKGRARMKDAKRYSLIIRGSLEDNLENKNRVLVKAMKNALRHYSISDKNKWKKKIEEKQKQEYDLERKKEQLDQRGKVDPSGYKLICKQCNEELVDAEDVVHVNEQHYIVDNWDDKYADRMTMIEINAEDRAKLSFATEDHLCLAFCVKCEGRVGTKIFIKVPCQFHGENVMLSKSGIRWRQGSGGKIGLDKFQWTKVPFRVRKEELLHFDFDDINEDDDDNLNPEDFFDAVD